MKRLFTLSTFILTCFHLASAQNSSGSVTGIVQTSDNLPGEGVTITLKNSTRNAITDNRGYFKIGHLDAGEYTLILTLAGYQDREESFSILPGENTSLDIRLSLTNRELGEVVVVGNRSSFKTNRLSNTMRVETPLLELPQNVQVITKKLIDDQQIFDMLEGVVRNVSGATRLEHWDNYALINMRGSSIAAFRNGMNVSTTWGPLTEDMSMVERIEFVKGPAGFMLANGDPSGFYNVVTKKPSGRNKGEVALSLGSFDLYRTAIDLDGKLSKDGKLLYRLNLMGQLKGSHRPYDFNNRYSIVPVLRYLVDDKTSVTLEFTNQFAEVNVIGSNYLFSKRGYADQPINATNAEGNLKPTRMSDRNLLAILEHRFNANWKFTAQGQSELPSCW